MSRREDRDYHGKRLHSRSEREPSPKKPRRDGKPATERTFSSSRNLDIDDVDDRDRKQRRRLQDALPLEASPATETKALPDIAKNGSDRKVDRSSDHLKHPSDPMEVPRPRSYFQHDERGSAGQGGRGYLRRATDHGRWSGPQEHSVDRVKGKADVHDVQKNHEGTQSRADEKIEWKHDGFYELDVEAPAARKRPAFREKKTPVEMESAAATAKPESRLAVHDQPTLGSSREKREDYKNSRGSDKPERPFGRADDRTAKRGDGSLLRNELHQAGYRSRERFGGGGVRGRDRFNGRYGERKWKHEDGFQVEKWKHDLFDEANRSPSPKNEEEQIAKIEALLAS